MRLICNTCHRVTDLFTLYYGTIKVNKYLFLGEPHSVANATTDPFKTLFVARIVSKSGN